MWLVVSNKNSGTPKFPGKYQFFIRQLSTLAPLMNDVPISGVVDETNFRMMNQFFSFKIVVNKFH